MSEQPDYLKTIRARGEWLGGSKNDLHPRFSRHAF